MVVNDHHTPQGFFVSCFLPLSSGHYCIFPQCYPRYWNHVCELRERAFYFQTTGAVFSVTIIPPPLFFFWPAKPAIYSCLPCFPMTCVLFWRSTMGKRAESCFPIRWGFSLPCFFLSSLVLSLSRVCVCAACSCLVLCCPPVLNLQWTTYASKCVYGTKWSWERIVFSLFPSFSLSLSSLFSETKERDDTASVTCTTHLLWRCGFAACSRLMRWWGVRRGTARVLGNTVSRRGKGRNEGGQ